MSEEDFVFAWVLATRVGNDGHWTAAKTFHLVEDAKRVFNQIKQEYNDETNSRTED